MEVLVDLKKVIPSDEYRNHLCDDEIQGFDLMVDEARDYLTFYDWCLDISEMYTGIYHAGIVGVFLFKIKPSKPEIDEWLWIIVGDLPPAYITCEESPNAACALDSYIGAMQEWVEAAESGNSVANLIPVNVPATRENAEALKTRLKLLDERVLNEYEDDLKEC